MTVSVNNQVNSAMKNSELRIGVIVPPDKHYKPVLYSDAEARKQFNKMNSDIYTQKKNYSFEDTKHTPKLISWGSGIAALATAGYLFLSKFKK